MEVIFPKNSDQDNFTHAYRSKHPDKDAEAICLAIDFHHDVKLDVSKVSEKMKDSNNFYYLFQRGNEKIHFHIWLDEDYWIYGSGTNGNQHTVIHSSIGYVRTSPIKKNEFLEEKLVTMNIARLKDIIRCIEAEGNLNFTLFDEL